VRLAESVLGGLKGFLGHMPQQGIAMAKTPLQRLWDELVERAWAEGHVVRGAPTAFALGVIISAAVLSCVVWKVVDILYSERIAVLEATIQNLQSRSGSDNTERKSAVRHLNPQQRTRLAAKLRTGQDEKFYVEFNSVPSCEECEDYADEFRNLFNSLHGWKSGGGVITFLVPQNDRIGLHLIVSSDYVTALNERLLSAFDYSEIPLQPDPPEKLPDGLHAIVVVGKTQK
jgi:hypothetical protein